MGLPLQLVGTMIISRLLTPEEVGIFAVAAAFAALASTFRDFGVGEYLIQEARLTEEKLRAALTMNICVSWFVGLLLYVFAPFAGAFYREPGVADVMRVQAVSFALIPFGAVTLAHFRREMDFKPIFLSSLLANITALSVAICGAMNGLGYMSLAWSSLAGVIVTVGSSLWFRPRRFPAWPGLRGLADIFNFGKLASGIYVFGQLGRGAPEMIIGRAQNAVDVAVFSRAGGLVEFFNRTVLRAVLPVCLPYFARGRREEGTVVNGYLISMMLLTAIGWPFLCFMAVMAYAAVRIVYGAQWTASVPLAQILCLVGCIELVHCMATEALIASGEVRRSALLQIGITLSRVAALLAAIPFGIVGASLGLLVASVVGAALSQRMLARVIGLSSTGVFRACSLSLWITIGSVGPVLAWVALNPVTESNYLGVALVAGVVTGTAWLLCVRWFGHPLWREISMLVPKLG